MRYPCQEGHDYAQGYSIGQANPWGACLILFFFFIRSANCGLLLVFSCGWFRFFVNYTQGSKFFVFNYNIGKW